MTGKTHWEKIYQTKSDLQVGWYEENPWNSLRLIKLYSSAKTDAILEVGGGNSFLALRLAEMGFTNLTVLDISLQALERNRSQFQVAANGITWVESDILDFKPHQVYHIWHDRAVFHFLTDDAEIRQYAMLSAEYIRQGGYLIMGAFSETGPKTCSGLPIVQYSADKFRDTFGARFELVETFFKTHITPSGNPQDYIWAVFRKR